MAGLIEAQNQNECETVHFGTFLDEHWGEEGNGSSFDSMGLKEELLRGIYSSGLERPNLVQQKVIPPILQGRDTFLMGRQGTGKTTSVLIGLLQKLNTNSDDNRKCQMIILTWARELAQEMMTRISELGAFLDIKAHCLLGGCSIRDDVRICREGVQIIVGTPGRVLDMIERGWLCVDHVNTIFLDEVGELLNRGFRDIIMSIFSRIPEARQTLFSDWTEPWVTREFYMSHLRNPLILQLSDDYSNDVSLENCFYVIAEDVEGVEESDSEFEKKFKALLTCLRLTNYRKIIFCNDLETVRLLHERLEVQEIKTVPVLLSFNGYDTHGFRGEWNQFQNRIFILSDRGIYVLEENHRYGYADIINFDIPKTPLIMRYRNGSKTCRGRKYARITIVTRPEMPRLLELGSKLNLDIFQAPMDADYYA